MSWRQKPIRSPAPGLQQLHPPRIAAGAKLVASPMRVHSCIRLASAALSMVAVLAMAVAPGSITFETTSLPMIVRNGATGDKHLVETMIAGIAAFDYDGDGWPDIFVANGASLPDLTK